MFRWLADFHQQSGAAASEEQDELSCTNELSFGSLQPMPQADQMRKTKNRGTLKGRLAPLLCLPSQTSMLPLSINCQSGGSAKKYCLSDEQLQELVRFLVWLHSRPLMQASVTERSWKSEDWDASDGSLTASEATSLGCEDDLDLSEVQLKALRRICEDENGQDSREPPTPDFGGCPRFVEDFSLADEQLQELVLYYHWYQSAMTDASSGPDSDVGLSTDKLHKLRMICEDNILCLAPTGSITDEPQTKDCEFGLSDARLQNLVCFCLCSRSRVSSTSLVAEPDNEFGISFDQVEEIKKFYGWCQSRRKSLKTCDPSSGLSEKRLGEHLARHGNRPVIMDANPSLHFKVPKPVLQSQPKHLPAKATHVYHFPITDQQLQDLVCLFIWSAAASEGADMEGCDDDLDLPLKQLEQLKTRCVEAEGQDSYALSGDVELASFAEDIGIVKQQLLALVRYCGWTCTLEGKCFTISATQLREVRTGCEVQGLTCSWTSNNEGMDKDCNVSDERLQNLMRFYTWRCSTLSCADLDDELGLPDKDFDELMQYLTWCESRAKAMQRQCSSYCDMCCDGQQMFALMPEAAAPKAVPPTTVETFPIEVCSPRYEQLITERLCTTEVSGEDGNCSVPFRPRMQTFGEISSEDADHDGELGQVWGGSFGLGPQRQSSSPEDADHDGELGHFWGGSFGAGLGPQTKSLSPTSDLPTSFEKASKTMEPTDGLDNSVDSDDSTMAGSSPNASSLRTSSGLSQGVVFSVSGEDSEDSTDERSKECTEYESASGDDQAISPVRVRVPSSPVVTLPLLDQRPSLTVHGMPWSVEHPCAKDDSALSVGTGLRDLWTVVSPRLDSLPRPINGSNLVSGPFVRKLSDIVVDSPRMRSEAKQITRRAVFSGCLGPSRVSPRADPHSDDEFVVDTPRLRPSRSQRGKAQTFCGVPQAADTWSWEDFTSASSSWWSSSILNRFKGCSCQQDPGADENYVDL